MGNYKYPWDKWFARTKRFKLKRGRDYACMTHAMAQQIRDTASVRGVFVSIQINEDDSLWVKVFK